MLRRPLPRPRPPSHVFPLNRTLIRNGSPFPAKARLGRLASAGDPNAAAGGRHPYSTARGLLCRDAVFLVQDQFCTIPREVRLRWLGSRPHRVCCHRTIGLSAWSSPRSSRF